MESPRLNHSSVGNVSCFSFNYYLMDYGTLVDESQLTLFSVLGNTTTEIWSSGTPVGADRWFAAKVQVDQPGPFSVSALKSVLKN